jgi:hypothetical protein
MIGIKRGEDGRRWWMVLAGAITRSIRAKPVRRGWPQQLFHGQFAITVFVERHQSGAGVGDFRGVNHAIMVGIECGNDGRQWTMTSAAAGTIRSTWSLARWWSVTVGRRTTGILCYQGPGRQANCKSHCSYFNFVFHLFFPFYVLWFL